MDCLGNAIITLLISIVVQSAGHPLSGFKAPQHQFHPWANNAHDKAQKATMLTISISVKITFSPIGV
jgi:hypothetical protein